MKAIIDRIEKDLVILLVGKDETIVNLPFALLPKGVREGDVIDFIISSDRQETYEQKNEVAEKFIQMFKKD